MKIFWACVTFFYGSLAGSYLNMLAYRLKRKMSLWSPARSFCDHCGKTLGALDLVPVLSYLVGSGKARCCGKRLSPLYPAVEMFFGLVFAAVALWLA